MPAHLPESVRDGPASVRLRTAADLDTAIRDFLDAAAATTSYREILERTEAALIRRAMAEAAGNQSVAAERLGLHRNTLRNKLRELGLDA